LCACPPISQAILDSIADLASRTVAPDKGLFLWMHLYEPRCLPLSSLTGWATTFR
jgi:hypothetical protein